MNVLRNSINIGLIIKIVGALIGLVGLFMLFPLLISCLDGGRDREAFIWSVSICLSIWILVFILVKKHHLGEMRFYKRDGYIAVAIAWIAAAFFSSLPYILSTDTQKTLTDAFFESMSGLTTTGATIMEDVEILPRGILLWRSMTQWIGGIGIVVFSIALLPLLGLQANQMMSAEITGPIKDKLHPRVAKTARLLCLIYFSLTLTQFLVLMLADMPWFDALCHSLTTISTGGFSTKNTSVAEFSPLIQYLITLFMFLAGVNFMIYYFIVKRNFTTLKKNEELYTYISYVSVFIIGGTFLLSVSEPAKAMEACFRDSAFHVVSVITTTGFVTAEYTLWHPIMKILLFLLMFSGACAGSSTGAMKISRIVLLIKNAWIEFKRAAHPRAVMPVKIHGKVVKPEIISQTLAFFFLYISVFALGAMLMAILGYDFETAMALSASSMGNVGPAMGEFCAFCNMAALPDAAKWIMSFLMLVGRLEVFTILVIFVPAFWKK